MKLQRTIDQNINTVTGYGPDHVMINRQRYEGNLLLSGKEVITGWASGGFNQLMTSDFDTIVTLQPEVVLIGTGASQHFPSSALLRPLIDAQIGFEIMNLAAACRTFNILVDEGRNVIAALLFEQT